MGTPDDGIPDGGGRTLLLGFGLTVREGRGDGPVGDAAAVMLTDTDGDTEALTNGVCTTAAGAAAAGAKTPDAAGEPSGAFGYATSKSSNAASAVNPV